MRVKSNELSKLMETVLKESVRSHSAHVVEGCREVSYRMSRTAWLEFSTWLK